MATDQGHPGRNGRAAGSADADLASREALQQFADALTEHCRAVRRALEEEQAEAHLCAARLAQASDELGRARLQVAVSEERADEAEDGVEAAERTAEHESALRATLEEYAQQATDDRRALLDEMSAAGIERPSPPARHPRATQAARTALGPVHTRIKQARAALDAAPSDPERVRTYAVVLTDYEQGVHAALIEAAERERDAAFALARARSRKSAAADGVAEAGQEFEALRVEVEARRVRLDQSHDRLRAIGAALVERTMAEVLPPAGAAGARPGSVTPGDRSGTSEPHAQGAHGYPAWARISSEAAESPMSTRVRQMDDGELAKAFSVASEAYAGAVLRAMPEKAAEWQELADAAVAEALRRDLFTSAPDGRGGGMRLRKRGSQREVDALRAACRQALANA